MDREKLTEQAKLRLFTGDQQFPANWSDVAEIAADFAIEQLAAVTAERDELNLALRSFSIKGETGCCSYDDLEQCWIVFSKDGDTGDVSKFHELIDAVRWLKEETENG